MKLGYTLLYVDSVEETTDFYQKAFGLELGFLHESKMYGEMQTGETKLGFVQHEIAKSHGFDYEKSSLNSKPQSFELGFVTDDVEAAFAKAIKGGAFPVCKPSKKPWGQIVSYVRDCNGFLVELCSPIHQN
jgi:lactoylglutathione lyase